MLIKNIYFGVQIALLILSGCAASDMCYRGILPKVYAAVIIIACAVALYSSVVLVSRNHHKEDDWAKIEKGDVQNAV